MGEHVLDSSVSGQGQRVDFVNMVIKFQVA
jgi:hypothetical protein